MSNPQQYPQHQPQYAPPKKKHTVRNVLLSVIGVFALLFVGCSVLVVGATGQSDDPGDSVSDSSAIQPNEETKAKAKADAKKHSKKVDANLKAQNKKIDEAQARADKATQMTPGQENALQAASDYLDMTAFSKKGLIQQLSSPAGDGYSEADAKFAANHVDANWKEQAAKAAKEYLDMTSFSRDGLIQQLSSPAGDGYTHSQAVYGVDQAGL